MSRPWELLLRRGNLLRKRVSGQEARFRFQGAGSSLRRRAPEITKNFANWCRSSRRNGDHRHARLFGGRTRSCA